MTAPRAGFALLAVLWVITALTALVGLGFGTLRLGQDVSFNRLALTRDRWAAAACLAIVQARWGTERLTDTATVDLGRAAACTWRVDDVGARLNVNTADPDVLRQLAVRVGADPAVADSLVAWRLARAFEDTAALEAVPGMTRKFQALLTVDGNGAVSTSAPPAVLLALPGMTPEAVEALERPHEFGQPGGSLDALAAELSPAARAVLLGHYAELARELAFQPPLLRITAVGWVAPASAAGLHATIEWLAVPLPDRLAVTRQRLW